MVVLLLCNIGVVFAAIVAIVPIVIDRLDIDWLVLDDFHDLDDLVFATTVFGCFVFVAVVGCALLLSIAATAAVFEVVEVEFAFTFTAAAVSVERAAFIVAVAVSIDGWVDCTSSRAACHLNLGDCLQARFLVDHAVSAHTNLGKFGLMFPGHSGGHETGNDCALVHC